MPDGISLPSSDMPRLTPSSSSGDELPVSLGRRFSIDEESSDSEWPSLSLYRGMRMDALRTNAPSAFKYDQR